MKIKGIGASNGFSTAKVFELVEEKIEISNAKIQDVDSEVLKLKNAIKSTIKQIEIIKEKASQNLNSTDVEIFDAHIQIASDPVIIQEIKAIINDKLINAIFATNDVTNKYISMFEKMNDDYMKERASDIKDVAKRIINNLAGVKNIDTSFIDEEVIIVAKDLTPSETSTLNKKYVKGFLTDIGGKTSHAAIMARSLEIPAILGLGDITKRVKLNDLVAMDGNSGVLLINPSQEEIKQFDKKEKLFREEQIKNLQFKDKPSMTKDGTVVELAANIGSLNDIESVIQNDAEGIGLFRSEFLYMNGNDWPTEDEQFKSYKTVLKKMKNKKVVIRTLDIGGDKKLKYFSFPEEINPFLGYRAIRLCLDKQEMFKTQLRALLRASIFGKLAIMFPMIATIEELEIAKRILDESKKELLKKKIKFSNYIEIGMMIEVPSAAILAKQFAKHVDFFSIGTNDLMQYMMAADRMNEKVAYLYQPLNPSILNMINIIIKGAHSEGKWVGMCGEMAGDKNVIPLLIGMGLDEFSMSATSILEARRLIASIDKNKAQKLVKEVLEKQTQKEIKQKINDFSL